MSDAERMNRLNEIVSAYSHNVFHVDCVADDVQWSINYIRELEQDNARLKEELARLRTTLVIVCE